MSTIHKRLVVVMLIITVFTSCKKYLDVKSDKQLVIPVSLADCQAILDYQLVMNGNYPSTEFFSDNFYLTFNTWNGLPLSKRDAYIWKADASTETEESFWISAYTKVLYANEVLETLENILPATPDEKKTWNSIRGAALFFRGYTFFTAAQEWAQPYNQSTAVTDLGIPLRLTADISAPTSRASVQQTYDRIIQDLDEAVSLLPDVQPTTIITKMRPCKTAAVAALAKVYMAMGDYIHAGTSANTALQNYSALINYNTLNSNLSFPAPRFNAEVIFHANGVYTSINATNAKVDSLLYNSYAANDLRKKIFFQANTATNAGTFAFKGSYDGGNSVSQFMGLATDELFLTRAECYARAGNTPSAMNDLNNLLRSRWTTGTYTDMTATDAANALSKILTERRKELLFRSIRWSDLRRLNKEPQFAITLKRLLNGQTYTLPPNDPRYTILIPKEVLRREPMPQNPR